MARAVAAVALAILMTAVLAPTASAWDYQCVDSNVVSPCEYLPMPLLRGHATPDGVQLSWSAPPGEVVEFRVHRCNLSEGPCRTDSDEAWDDGLDGVWGDAAEWVVFSAGTERTYLDKPEVGGVYVYYVTSMIEKNFEVKESPPSNPVAVAWAWPYCQPVTGEGLAVPQVESECVLPLPYAGIGQ